MDTMNRMKIIMEVWVKLDILEASISGGNFLKRFRNKPVKVF